MSELTALMAAIVLGGLVAVSTVGGSVQDVVGNLFNPVSAPADFSAKFIRP